MAKKNQNGTKLVLGTISLGVLFAIIANKKNQTVEVTEVDETLSKTTSPIKKKIISVKKYKDAMKTKDMNLLNYKLIGKKIYTYVDNSTVRSYNNINNGIYPFNNIVGTFKKRLTYIGTVKKVVFDNNNQFNPKFIVISGQQLEVNVRRNKDLGNTTGFSSDLTKDDFYIRQDVCIVDMDS